MNTKEVQVTDDQIRKKAEECGTFSGEYWRSMTVDQQEELVKLRESNVTAAAYRVHENERARGIREKMEELRSCRGSNDEAIRDLYFSISDERARIKAINDLFNYERTRKSHDMSMVLEAYFRYEGVRQKLTFGWAAWSDLRNAVLLAVAFNAAALAVRLFWPSLKTEADWFAGASAVYVAAYVVYWIIDLRRWESHYFLLWEIEKLRRGTQVDDIQLAARRYDLFSGRERESGRRSVPREMVL